MFDDDFEEEELLDEIRESKTNIKSVLNKKKLSKWEMDEAMTGEM